MINEKKNFKEGLFIFRMFVFYLRTTHYSLTLEINKIQTHYSLL